MENRKALWSTNQTLLRNLLAKPDKFDEAIELCLEQHAMVHSSEASQCDTVTFEDQLWDGLTETAFRVMPTVKDATIAWNMWHLTRIEDITMNILVAGDNQVFNSGNWLTKMNVQVSDTGNAMSDDEIIALSSGINMQALRNYRISVAVKTREIIKQFKAADLKRKMAPERLQRILDEGAVLNVEGASWLIDFWGRKNVAGILLMPVTRHHLVHINDSMRLKRLLMKKGN